MRCNVVIMLRGFVKRAEQPEGNKERERKDEMKERRRRRRGVAGGSEVFRTPRRAAVLPEVSEAALWFSWKSSETPLGSSPLEAVPGGAAGGIEVHPS